MNLNRYHNKSANNVVNKNIKAIDVIEGIVIKEYNSLKTKNPSLLIELSGDFKNVADFNYCYIPQTERYYYVENISSEGMLLRIDLQVDVLMSFKSDILDKNQAGQIIERQAKKLPEASKYLADDVIPVRSDNWYASKTFGDSVSSFTSQRIIVETAGRGGRVV